MSTFFDIEENIHENDYVISPSGIKWQRKYPYFVNVEEAKNNITENTYRATPIDANSTGWTLKKYSCLDELTGHTIISIYMSEKYLVFNTKTRQVAYECEADCCSESVFYDFIGVKKLLKGNPIIATNEIPLQSFSFRNVKQWTKDRNKLQNCVEVYGYEIITEDEKFGDVTSVFSFRNYSNGAYGGNLSLVDTIHFMYMTFSQEHFENKNTDQLRCIIDDVSF